MKLSQHQGYKSASLSRSSQRHLIQKESCERTSKICGIKWYVKYLNTACVDLKYLNME